VCPVLVTLQEMWGSVLISTVATLHDPAGDTPMVSDDKIATFYAAAELNVRCLLLELESKY
jgi:hypothetical protein